MELTHSTSRIWTSQPKCRGAYIRPTGLKGSTGSTKDHQHESLHALREVRHLPPGSGGDGGNKDDICRRIYQFKTGKKRIKKQWKYREKKEELHTFKNTTQEKSAKTT